MTSGLYLTRGLHLVLYEQASLDDVWEFKADGSLKDYSAWGTLYGGLAATERIRAQSSVARILVLSAHEDVTYAKRALEVGASGYLTKRSAAEELIEAIRSVADDRVYLEPEIHRELLAQFPMAFPSTRA